LLLPTYQENWNISNLADSYQIPHMIASFYQTIQFMMNEKDGAMYKISDGTGLKEVIGKPCDSVDSCFKKIISLIPNFEDVALKYVYKMTGLGKDVKIHKTKKKTFAYANDNSTFLISEGSDRNTVRLCDSITGGRYGSFFSFHIKDDLFGCIHGGIFIYQYTRWEHGVPIEWKKIGHLNIEFNSFGVFGNHIIGIHAADDINLYYLNPVTLEIDYVLTLTEQHKNSFVDISTTIYKNHFGVVVNYISDESIIFWIDINKKHIATDILPRIRNKPSYKGYMLIPSYSKGKMLISTSKGIYIKTEIREQFTPFYLSTDIISFCGNIVLLNKYFASAWTLVILDKHGKKMKEISLKDTLKSDLNIYPFGLLRTLVYSSSDWKFQLVNFDLLK
jgi:hypothetical protein